MGTARPFPLPSLPNWLSGFRLIAAPCLPLCLILLPRPMADWTVFALVLVAGVTDWLDGWIARRFQLTTRLGAMLDSIADKVLVIIALAVLMALSGLNPIVAIPATAIIFREVFVSGLREQLGNAAGTLRVTRLAKYKTTLQLLGILVLLLVGIFQLEYEAIYYANDPFLMDQIAAGTVPDSLGVGPVLWRLGLAEWGGSVLIWLAAGLTVVSGLDYFRKALPHLVD